MDSPTERRLAHRPRATRTWLIDRFRQHCGYRFPRLGRVAFAGIMKALPSSCETQLFPGIRATLDLRDETQRTTYWFGTRFEEPTPQVLQAWARDATHFFDIGSNYGFYSFLLHSAEPHLEIFSFEPNPKSFDLLRKIQEANAATRIHPQAYGLSDAIGRLQFLQLSGNSGHSSFATVEDYSAHDLCPVDGQLTECDVIPFDVAVTRLQIAFPVRPSWIAKVDVEGFELKVLEGMSEALSRRAFRGICIELFPENLALAGASLKQIDALLQKYGYAQMPNSAVGRTQTTLNHNAYYTLAD